jgi:hypothetical protein
MLYFDWTQSQMHHAMHMTGVVNIDHVTNESGVRHPHKIKTLRQISIVDVLIQFGLSCLTQYGYLLCLYKIYSPLPWKANLLPSAVMY